MKVKHAAIVGVNLGAWLLLEKWMTPSLFKGIDAEDEYSFMQTEGAAKKIEQHRKEFMKEEDWRWLSERGIMHVRLPVGYWVLHNDAPYKNARKYLDWAFKMAEKYNMKILIDLHGLKGSQNGTMHSGKIGPVEWKKFEAENLAVLQELAERYRDSRALWGIEIINEPRIFGHYFALLGYYRKAYKMLRGVLRPGTLTVFQDGFVPPLLSGSLWQRKDYPVAMDTHFYLILPERLGDRSPKGYDRFRKMLYATTIWLTQLSQPVIVGEWGSVLPQAMFDRVPKKEHLPMLGGTIKRQRKMYRNALATFYWSYKAEGRGMYHYRSLVEDGVI